MVGDGPIDVVLVPPFVSDQVLVSSTVRDLVAGSGIHFEDMSVHRLKGVPGHSRLFSAN